MVLPHTNRRLERRICILVIGMVLSSFVIAAEKEAEKEAENPLDNFSDLVAETETYQTLSSIKVPYQSFDFNQHRVGNGIPPYDPVLLDKIYLLDDRIESHTTVWSFDTQGALPSGVKFELSGAIRSNPHPLQSDQARTNSEVDRIKRNVRYSLQGSIDSFEPPRSIVEYRQMMASQGRVRPRNRIGLDIPDRKPPQGERQVLNGTTTPDAIVASANILDYPFSLLRRAGVQARENLESSIATSLRYRTKDDGFRNTQELYATASPAFRLYLEGRRWSFENRFLLNAGQSWSDNSQTIIEQQFETKFRRTFGGRSLAGLRAKYAATEDVQTRNFIDNSLIKSKVADLELEFRRGRTKDRVVFVGFLSRSDANYDGNFDIEDSSYVRTGLKGNVHYKFRRRISYSLGFNYDVYDYGVSALSSKESNIHVGSEFALSRKINGKAQVGIQSKNFAANSDGAASAFWDIAIDWRPRRNTGFQLTTSRHFVESYESTTDTEFGNETVSREVALGWSQTWSSRMSSVIGLSNSIFSYNQGGLSRDAWSLALNYQFRRRILLSMSLESYESEAENMAATISNQSSIEFKADIKL